MWLLTGCGAPPPDTLGETDGSLASCEERSNCVHTGLGYPTGVTPMYLRDGIEPSEVMQRVRSVVADMPRTRIVTQQGAYLHAEERSRLLRFIDDLELLVAPDGELIVRSASRLGRSDLGVNGRRVERLRSRLEEAGLLR